MIFKSKLLSILFLIYLVMSLEVDADDFQFNNYNNHGVVGLINMPTARSFNDAVHGITLYSGDPDQKLTFSSNPYSWLEASFFYMNIEEIQQCRSNIEGQVFCQGYKDKGFNIKIKVKDEGYFPAIALGINDIAGTGFYSSEYIVGSYGINNLDFHFGIGWDALNDQKNSIKNPFGYVSKSFENRPSSAEGLGAGGQFQLSRYFSGKTVAPFWGFTYAYNNKVLLKFERDTTNTPGKVNYELSKSNFSYGIDYSLNNNLNIGLAFERGNHLSFRFQYKNNPKLKSKKNTYEFKKAPKNIEDNKYDVLIKNLEKNGVGVNKIIETTSSIGLDLTQFAHPNLQIIEQIIYEASSEAGINKNIKKDLRIVDLKAVSEIENDDLNAKVIYEREKRNLFNTNTSISFRPFIASREEFFKGALLAENNSELVLKDNLILHTNLKYSLADNLDDLTLPPIDTYPAQVRSDVKKYLRNIDQGILIGRAQIDYFITPFKNHHLMFSAGILEDMFSGFGLEYLFFKNNTNYSFGFELFNVKKRDYDWGFGTLDYENVTGHINFNYRNYGIVPFDMKVSYGEYLAGDVGSTIELSRSYKNGMQFGVFVSNTDVTAEQFGEGSFDKGVFFKIPIYGNLFNYTWRPLTKDPASKLIRRNNLNDLLVRFKPIN